MAPGIELLHSKPLANPQCLWLLAISFYLLFQSPQDLNFIHSLQDKYNAKAVDRTVIYLYLYDICSLRLHTNYIYGIGRYKFWMLWVQYSMHIPSNAVMMIPYLFPQSDQAVSVDISSMTSHWFNPSNLWLMWFWSRISGEESLYVHQQLDYFHFFNHIGLIDRSVN